jgi:hypothetical protein
LRESQRHFCPDAKVGLSMNPPPKVPKTPPMEFVNE